MCEKPVSVQNVVIYFKLKKIAGGNLDREWVVAVSERAPSLGFSTKHLHNFVVFKKDKLTFSLFTKSAHVNSSGTSSFEGVDATLAEANALFGVEIPSSDVKVSSSTWSGRFAHTLLSIPATKCALEEKRPLIRVSLRSALFPGAVIREDHSPTLILFRNGKYIVVGAKSGRQVFDVVEQIRPHVRCLCCPRVTSHNGRHL